MSSILKKLPGYKNRDVEIITDYDISAFVTKVRIKDDSWWVLDTSQDDGITFYHEMRDFSNDSSNKILSFLKVKDILTRKESLRKKMFAVTLQSMSDNADTIPDSTLIELKKEAEGNMQAFDLRINAKMDDSRLASVRYSLLKELKKKQTIDPKLFRKTVLSNALKFERDTADTQQLSRVSETISDSLTEKIFLENSFKRVMEGFSFLANKKDMAKNLIFDSMLDVKDKIHPDDTQSAAFLVKPFVSLYDASTLTKAIKVSCI